MMMRWPVGAILLLLFDIGHGRQGGSLKVLYIEHLPRWEFRYLKNALVDDRDVLCHTYLLCADKDYTQSHSSPNGRRDASVKRHAPFFEPIERLPRDLSEWLRYDAVILGDVNPGDLGSATARNLEKYVREHGGGLILIAGSRYGPEAYSGTALESLLPVNPAVEKAKGAFDKTLRYSLGSPHEITRFDEDQAKNRKLWEEADGIPGVLWYRAVQSAKPDATVLAEIKDPRAPLFVVRPYGRGRVFLSLTDETWHWRHLRGDEPYFYPFWKRAIFWVSAQKR